MLVGKIEPAHFAPVPLNQDYVRARVVDVETTSSDPADSDVIEYGWVDVWFPRLGGQPFMSERFDTLVKPNRPITVEAMAVHHITDAEAATGISQDELKELVLRDPPDYYVAHNSKFEAALLDPGGRPWICTYKTALRAFPDAVRHTNQVLRYALGLPVDPVLSQPPHRAGPDAYVTAHLLIRLAEDVRIEQMLEWSSLPAKFPTIAFGKHKGATWDSVPESYLRWMLNDGKFDEDVEWNARTEIERRRASLEAVKQVAPPDQAELPMDACGPGW